MVAVRGCGNEIARASERARVRLDFRTRSTLHLGHIDAVIGRLFQTKVVKSARQSAELVHVR